MLDALFSTVSDRSSRREVLPDVEGSDGEEVVDVLDVDVSDVEYVADGGTDATGCDPPPSEVCEKEPGPLYMPSDEVLGAA